MRMPVSMMAAKVARGSLGIGNTLCDDPEGALRGEILLSIGGQ